MPTTIHGATANSTHNTGQHGDASRQHLFTKFSGTAAGTQVILGEFVGGCTVDGIRIVHDALGAGSSLKLGVVFPDGLDANNSTQFGTHNTAAAGTPEWKGKPFSTQNRYQLVAEVVGAAATGDIDVLVDFRFRGLSHA